MKRVLQAEAFKPAEMTYEYHGMPDGTHRSVIDDAMASVFAFLAEYANFPD